VSLLFFLIGSKDMDTDLRCFAFAIAILLSALFGGLGPGLLATGLSAFANAFIFFPPAFSMHIASAERVARLVMFTGEGSLLAFVGPLFRDARTVDIEVSWKRYLPATLFVFTATGLKLLAFRNLEQQVPFTFYYAAIAASAWSGGFGAGLLATFLASMTARYFFLDPQYSFSVSSLVNGERVFLFVAEGILLSGLSGKYAGARRVAVAAIAQVRQYEQHLRKSIQDVRALRLTSDDVVWEWDLTQDRMIRGATRIERPGTAVASMTFDSWLKQVHPEDRSLVRTSLESALRGGHDEWNCEYRRLRPGGKFAYVSDHALVFRDAERNTERMVGRTADLNRSTAPARAHGHPEGHPAMLEQNPIVVLVTNGFLRIVSANQAAPDALGYSTAELSGRPLENIFRPHRRRIVADTLIGLNPFDRASVTFVEDCVRSDGKIFRAKINSVAILNLDGFTSSRVIMIERAPE
jgi:PAS domain S-box-containing protein